MHLADFGNFCRLQKLLFLFQIGSYVCPIEKRQGCFLKQKTENNKKNIVLTYLSTLHTLHLLKTKTEKGKAMNYTFVSAHKVIGYIAYIAVPINHWSLDASCFCISAQWKHIGNWPILPF